MYFVMVYGPTAVGKTELVLALAQRHAGLMINADVGQFYKPLSIGTAKPPLAALTIPTCLFDVIDAPVDYTVVQFRGQLEDCFVRAQQDNLLPIIVGGSGFYVGSIFYPPSPRLRRTGPPTSGGDTNAFDGFTTPQLWQQLATIDPVRAQQINASDRYRIIRALSIWQSSKQLPSQAQPLFAPPGKFLFVMLTRERDDLYQRINERVHAMINAGWIDEVRALKGTGWESFLKRKKLLGYPEIFEYLDGKQSTEQLIATIAQKTRNYAKRQLTFGRMLVKKLLSDQSRIEIINLTHTDPETAVKKIATLVQHRST